jgi:diaminopimelate decarboxylase
VLDLLPESARIEGGELTLGGLRASDLADRHGTPLLVYCEQTIRSQVRAYREAAPDALIVYGTKAFANVALLRLFADLGVGADVSTLGELGFARAAGIPGDCIVFHGNNKSEESCGRRRRRRRSSCSTRPARRRRRQRRACGACSCG